jgi:hypothetical protein
MWFYAFVPLWRGRSLPFDAPLLARYPDPAILPALLMTSPASEERIGSAPMFASQTEMALRFPAPDHASVQSCNGRCDVGSPIHNVKQRYA